MSTIDYTTFVKMQDALTDPHLNSNQRDAFTMGVDAHRTGKPLCQEAYQIITDYWYRPQNRYGK